jgi:hypothetical protein
MTVNGDFKLASAVDSTLTICRTLDPNQVTAYATVVLAVLAVITSITSIITIIILMKQTKVSRLQTRVTILMKYTDEFDSHLMQDARIRASEALKIARETQKIDGLGEIEDVLDFFEGVALLVRQKAIEPILVWHSFFYWIHRYYSLGKDYIDSVRKDPKERSTWEDLVWLHPRLLKIEKKRNGCKYEDLKLSKQELEDFLEDESCLGERDFTRLPS